MRLDGGRLNREGIGARVTLEAGGRRQVREVTYGRSILSASFKSPCSCQAVPRFDAIL